MRIEWQSLAPNPWFQLCALVAVLSGGMTIYNLTQHSQTVAGDGTTPAPGPPPISITTPTPPPTLKAKARGHWIVDANGATDADSRDLREVVANLADGDTVTLRPGSYQGGFNVTKSATFVGQGANQSAVSVHTSFQDTVTVSGKSASFENLTIGQDSPGDQFHALHCIGVSHVELSRSLIGSKGEFGALVSDTASLDAHNSSFQTSGIGCGLVLENNSHGALRSCAFSSNRWGLHALNAAHVQLTSCSFQKNGKSNGDGWILGVEGGQAHIAADQCQFISNTAVLKISESGSLSLTNSLFKDNGVTGEQGNVSDGLISVTSSGKATLSNVTFESNKQGITVGTAGSVTISGCHFSNTGIHTESEYFQYLSNAISVSGQGSSAIVNQGTAISKTTTNGIVAVEGAQLTLEDASVESSSFDGILGGNDKGGAMLEVRRGRFISNQDGIFACSGSTGTIQDCQFVGNTACGVSLAGAKTKVSIAHTEFRGNKNYGLWIGDSAEGQATGCLIDGSERGAQVGVAGKPDGCGTMMLDNCTVTNNSILGIAACVKSTMLLRGVRFGGNHNPNIYKERNSTVQEDFKNMLVK